MLSTAIRQSCKTQVRPCHDSAHSPHSSHVTGSNKATPVATEPLRSPTSSPPGLLAHCSDFLDRCPPPAILRASPSGPPHLCSNVTSPATLSTLHPSLPSGFPFPRPLHFSPLHLTPSGVQLFLISPPRMYFYRDRELCFIHH